MTRKKKSRSLKRIHSVKTGNVSKLKKAANTNRQSKVNSKKRTKSVYEKFLEENPDIAQAEAQKQQQQQAKQEQAKQQAELAQQQEQEQKQKAQSAKDDDDGDLLGQLDKKSFDDLY